MQKRGFIMLHPGLYEQVINNALTSELSQVPETCKAIASIDAAEAPKILSKYLTGVIQKGLDNILFSEKILVADVITQKTEVLTPLIIRICSQME